jgi:hypothetical protein
MRTFTFERNWVKSGQSFAPTASVVDLLAEVDSLRAEVTRSRAVPHMPRRDDAVATWLKWLRDAYAWDRPTWSNLDEVLDLYRLHADTGTPLDQRVCEGPNCNCPEAE